MLTLKQVFWKTRTFFKKLEYDFLVQGAMNESAHFQTKLPCQKPILRQTEWGVRNGAIIKLPIAQNIYIHTFILHIHTAVLFEGVFSLWVSIIWYGDK